MSETQPGNSEYIRKIINTDLSQSKLSSALQPQLGGLRVIKGTFDVTDLTVARDGVATDATLAQNENVFLRDSAGAPIQVNDGDIIVSLTLTSTTAFTAVSEVDIELLDQTTNGSGVLIPTGTPDVIIDGGTTLTSAPAYLDNIATPVYFSVASPNTFLSVTNVAATSAIAGAFTLRLLLKHHFEGF